MPNYAPGDKPTVPGHETVLRIVKVGEPGDPAQSGGALPGADRLPLAADGQLQLGVRLQF